MKILILGAQGNLGTQIFEKIKDISGVEVFALSRSECDVTIYSDLNLKIQSLKPDIIINTVAYNNVDGCEKNLQEQKRAIELNITLVKNLAEICNRSSIKLIQFSTNYVFSGNEEMYTEYSKPDPINFYGLTKLMGEEAILELEKQGLKACIIRISNLFGVSGTSKSSKPDFFDVMNKAYHREKNLNVVADEINCFTYSADVASEVLDIIEKDQIEGIYHVANTNALSWFEAASIYFKLKNFHVVLNPIDGTELIRSAKRPQKAILASTRRKELRSFDEAMSEYIQLE